MVSFKSIIIPYITVFFNCVLVFADDSTLIVQGGKSDAANITQPKSRGDATEALIEEVLRIGGGFVDHYQFAHYFYIIWMNKKDDHKDYIETKKQNEVGLFNRFRVIQNALKTTENDELVDNTKKLTDILIEYKEYVDEFYKKVLYTLEGEDAKNFEHANKNHRSVLLGLAVNAFDNMIKVLNSILPEKVPSSKLKEFEEFIDKIGELRSKVYNKEGNYNAFFKEMLEKGIEATENFNTTIDSVAEARLVGGEKIDGNLISSIKTLATTVTQLSNAILPGLLAIAISSLIFIIS